MNNLIASPKYNNNSINNSLLLNKSVEKFDQKQNPRNISQSMNSFQDLKSLKKMSKKLFLKIMKHSKLV